MPKSYGSVNKVVTVYSDSMITLADTKSPKFNSRTKTIVICYHYIRDVIV